MYAIASFNQVAPSLLTLPLTFKHSYIVALELSAFHYILAFASFSLAFYSIAHALRSQLLYSLYSL